MAGRAGRDCEVAMSNDIPFPKGLRVVDNVVEVFNQQDCVKAAETFAANLRAWREQGKEARSVTMVFETHDGAVEVFGWGDTGLLRSIGVLHLGIARLAQMRLPKD